MITPIPEHEFHTLFKHPKWHRFSPAAVLQARVRETRWFRNHERDILGVVIWEKVDKDWQAIALRKEPIESKNNYHAYEIFVSLPTENAAVEKLFEVMA